METTALGIVLGGIILIGFLLRKYSQRNKDYWKKRGIPEIKSKDGTIMALWNVATRKKQVAIDYDVEFYQNMGSEPFGGTTSFGFTNLLIKDPELIKNILVKDFDHFVDRRKLEMHSEPIFTKMVSQLEGQEWKNVRSVMSPTFTTGKIRRMFEHFNRCGSHLVDFICTIPVGSPKTRDVIVKDAFSRYLVDVISATAFGLDTSSLKDPNSMFYKMAKQMSEFSMWKLLKAIAGMVMPFLTRLGLRFSDSESTNFFINICKTALKNRENSNEKRDDFLQLMIEARRGELKTEEGELDAFEKNAQLSKSGDGAKAKIILTDELITAQSLLFFLAGLDTTGSLLCFAVYLLALHPDIQNKLFQEVSQAMKERDGKLDYDATIKLEYMEKFISEILRMYPFGTRMERRCTKDYKLPNGTIIEKDMMVIISPVAMHRDPNIYPNPEKFDPERFTPEEKAKRNPYVYLPFGQGPRNCIGMRFALMEAKVAIAYLVYNFGIEPCECTPVPIKVDKIVGSRPIVDLKLRFKERQHF